MPSQDLAHDTSATAHGHFPARQGLYDPRHEHDCLRRRLRGRRQGEEVPRHRRTGAGGAPPPGPPRRRRCRPADRRRGGHPGADTPRVPDRRLRQGGDHPSRRRLRLRRRDRLPADRLHRAAFLPRDDSRAGRQGGHAAAGLAPGAGRPVRHRRDGPPQPAADRAALPRLARRGGGRAHLRAGPLPAAQADRERGPGVGHQAEVVLLHHQPLLPHADLQGPADARAGRPLLPRPARSGARRAPWPWSTRATAPTPSRPGTWPSPSASWPTTARSTPFAATSTGCGPARAPWPRPTSAATWST